MVVVGGLLIVYSNNSDGSGKLESNGSNSISTGTYTYGFASGGSSGGGSINVLLRSEYRSFLVF